MLMDVVLYLYTSLGQWKLFCLSVTILGLWKLLYRCLQFNAYGRYSIYLYTTLGIWKLLFLCLQKK